MRILNRNTALKSLWLAVLLALLPSLLSAQDVPPLRDVEKPFVGKWHAVAEGETPPYVWNWFDLELRENRQSTITHPYKDGLNTYGGDYWRLKTKFGMSRLPLAADVYASRQLTDVKWLDDDTMSFSWTAGGFAGSYTYKATRVKP